MNPFPRHFTFNAHEDFTDLVAEVIRLDHIGDSCSGDILAMIALHDLRLQRQGGEVADETQCHSVPCSFADADACCTCLNSARLATRSLSEEATAIRNTAMPYNSSPTYANQWCQQPIEDSAMTPTPVKTKIKMSTIPRARPTALSLSLHTLRHACISVDLRADDNNNDDDVFDDATNSDGDYGDEISS